MALTYEAWIPFQWEIRPSSLSVSCPSPAAVLGTFAAVNIAASVLAVFCGHQRLVSAVTFGLFGRKGSKSWKYKWTFSVGVQLAANAAVAALIYNSPDVYHLFDIWELMLFYIARPRLSWIVVGILGTLNLGPRWPLRAKPRTRDSIAMGSMQPTGGAYRQDHINERVDRMVKEMDLEPYRDSRAGKLSGGYKQLLSMACALIHEPALLFLDEPTAGLDPVHRQQIWDFLYQVTQSGTTIFVTTHYMDEAERCTDVGFVQHGRLVAKGSPRQLKQALGGDLLEVHVEPPMAAVLELRKFPGISGVDLRSGRLRIHAADPQALVDQWQQYWPFPGLKFLGYSWVEPDMEDVFNAYAQGRHSQKQVQAALK
jgi:ABC-type sugar transport system ATPase subunit